MKMELETLGSTPKIEDGRRAVMFHRINPVGVKEAVQVKPLKQTRPSSDADSDMDDHILNMYKR